MTIKSRELKLNDVPGGTWADVMLHQAVLDGNLSGVKCALDDGADPNRPDKNSFQALHTALGYVDCYGAHREEIALALIPVTKLDQVNSLGSTVTSFALANFQEFSKSPDITLKGHMIRARNILNRMIESGADISAAQSILDNLKSYY